ncbi:hypothetical protein D3Z38_03660 [Clostridiales bacterium]|nr:hypothetical protein [Clostridiales bacterium]
MKKTLKNFILVIMLVFSFASITSNIFNTSVVVSAKSNVSISAKKLTLLVGKKKRLRIQGTRKKIKWSSSKKSVAIVNAKGTVTAKKEGKATIIAKVGRKKYKCVVTVKRKHTHTYKRTVVAPTCTSEGYDIYTCNCGNTYKSNYIPKINHIEVVDVAIKPTYTQTGLTEGKHCSVCGKVIVEQKIIPRLTPSEASNVECFIVNSYKTWKPGSSYKEYIEYAVDPVAIEKEDMGNDKFKTTITVNLVVLHKTQNAPNTIKGEWLFISDGHTAGGGMYSVSDVEEGEIRQVKFTNYDMTPGNYRVTFSSYFG